MPHHEHEYLRALLTELRVELLALLDTHMQVATRTHDIVSRLDEGQSMADIVGGKHGRTQLIVNDLADEVAMLNDLQGRLRRAYAKALHDEGWSMDVIADRLGVTRQRVSQLLHAANADLVVFAEDAEDDVPYGPYPLRAS